MDAATARVLISMQVRRCELASKWTAAFNDLLQGRASPDRYTHITTADILPEASRISAEFVALRDDTAVPEAVRRVVSAIQVAEKKLFESSLRYQQLHVTHLTGGGGGANKAPAAHLSTCAVISKVNKDHFQPNVLSSLESERVANVGLEHDEGEAETGGGDDSAVPVSNCVAVRKELEQLKTVIQSAQGEVTDLLEELQAEISDASSPE